MSELKLPRLLAAAKEFNIGQDTLVDFLANKGFNRDDLKPTAKLTEDMYIALQREFQSDKVAKTKADQIEIPKGTGGERKKKEEEKKKKAEIVPPELSETEEIIRGYLEKDEALTNEILDSVFGVLWNLEPYK